VIAVADEGKQAGQAFVSITPDFRNFHKSIEKQLQGVAPQFAKAGTDAGRAFSDGFRKSLGDPFGPLKPPDQTPSGAKSGGEFAAGFKKAVEAAIRSLPRIQLDADASPAERRIQEIRAELAELSGKTIGVDLSDDEAVAKLTALRAELDAIGARSKSIRIQVDTSAAAGELAGFVGEEEAATGGANALSQAFSGGTTQLGAMISLGISLAPVLATAAATAAGLAGALASAAGAGAAGIGGFALVAVPAVTQIKNALTAQKTAQQAATGAAGQATQTEQAHALALQQVQQAEQSLTTAQQQAKTAQQALSAARVQARKDAVDLANSVTDAELQEKSDVLGVIGARQALLAQEQQTAAAEKAVTDARSALATAQGTAAGVNANPGSTAAQKAAAAAAVAAAKQQLQAARQAAAQQELAQRQAKLAVAQAIQQLKEQRIAVQRLQQQQAASDKAGISGDKNVIAARRQVRQADQQVQQAELALARARLSASRAGAAETSAGSSSAAKAAAAMAALSGPQRTLLKAWQALTGEYNRWAKSLQKPVLNVLTNGLRLAGRLLPALTPFVTGTARAFDGLLKKAGKALGGPFWTTFAKTMSKLAPKAITGFGTALLNIATGLAGIAQAFAPVAGPVLKGLVKLTAGFASWGKQLGKSSAFQQFITYFKANGPAFLDLIFQLVKLFLKFGVALLPLGAVMTKVALKIVKFLASMPPDEILAIVAAITVLLSALLGGIPLLIAATVAVAAVIAAKWKTISKAFRTAWKAITGAFGDAVGWITRTARSFWSGVQRIWNDGISGIKRGWDDLWGGIKSAASTVWTALKTGVGTLWDWIKTAFSTGVKAVGKVWSGLKSTLKAPVNWVIQHIWDHGIEALWNKAAGIVHLPKLPDIPLLANGGVISRPTMAVVGEAGPEMVLPLSRPGRMAELLGQAGIPMLADGGIFGSIGGFLGGLAKKFGGWVQGNLSHVFGGVAGKLVNGIASHIPGGTTAGSFGSIIAALPKAIVHNLAGWLGKKDSVPVATGGGEVTRWAPIVRFVLRALHQPLGDVAAVLHRIEQESGGRPNAINLWDINAQRGDPSRGLMQTIGSTFAAYAGPYRSRGIYDPLASIYAGINYAIHAYSKPLRDVMLQPGGYDSGGWMMPGYGTYLNATRKPEAVLTNSQWAAVSAAVQGGDGATHENHFYLGDVGGTVEARVRAAVAASDIATRRTVRPGRKR
jgi:SLT domain-containing protein